VHGAQNNEHARHEPLYHYQEQKEHNRAIGIEEVQSNLEKIYSTQRN